MVAAPALPARRFAWLRMRRKLDRLARIASSVCMIGLVLLTFNQAFQGITPELALWRDFGQDYLLGRALVDGIDPYVPVRELAQRYVEPTGFLARTTPAPHPPSMAVLVLPLLLLDYTNAVRAWFVLQIGALLIGVCLTLRSVGARWAVAAQVAPAATLLLFLWPAIGLDVGLGQSTTLLLALLAGAQCALGSGRSRLGGVLLGVSMLVKPLAWPWLLVFAARRMWSASVATLAIALIGWTMPALRIGIGPIVGYFVHTLPAVSATYATEVTNFSWWTIGPRLFDGTSAFGTAVPPLLDAPTVAGVVGVALPGLVLALAVTWLMTMRPRSLAAFGVMTAVALLINPISWGYYFVLMLLPIAALAAALLHSRWPAGHVIVALGCIGLLIPIEGQLVDLARQLSPDRALAPLPTLITLAPSLGVAGIGVLLARHAVSQANLRNRT